MRKETAPGSERILVADDNAYYLTTIADALSEAGFEVTSCAEGFGALRAIEQGAVDLAILNRDLPGLAGADIVRRLRREGSELPILIMDVFTRTGREAEELRGTGASGYFNKSLPIEEIVYRIRDLLFPAPEGRKSPRTVRYVPLSYAEERGEALGPWHASYSFTISADGMYVQSADPPAPQSRVRLRFRVRSRQDPEVEVRGRVMYRHRPDPAGRRSIVPGMAVQFEDLDEDARRDIAALVIETLVSSVRTQGEVVGPDARLSATERVVTCKSCTGLGKVPYEPCRACEGRPPRADCRTCRGTGQNPWILRVCQACGGIGSLVRQTA
ncbi:MAG: response regulator [Acidobacteriota bacterium]